MVTHADLLTVLTVKILKLNKNHDGGGRYSGKKWKHASLCDCKHFRLFILTNKTANIIKQSWNPLLLIVKATALKQQISKFSAHILSTEASFYILRQAIVW